MAKQYPSEAAREETRAFREKGGKSVGERDSVVDGHLSGIAGATQETHGGKPGDVRPMLEERDSEDPAGEQPAGERAKVEQSTGERSGSKRKDAP